jgi:hypothetical protein
MTKMKSSADTKLFELIGKTDPILSEAPPTDEATEAAFRALIASGTAASPALGARARRPRRVLVRASAGVAAAGAVAFAAVNLLPASQTPGAVGAAWAKRVIAHAAVAAAGSGSGILHIVATTTSGNYTGTYQSWDSKTSSDTFWSTDAAGADNTTGPNTGMLTLSGDTLESYDAASNTLREVQRIPPSRAMALEAEGNPAYAAVLELTEYPGAATTTSAAPSQTPETFSDLIAALLKDSGVTADTGASVNGQSAIRISDQAGARLLYSLYVAPQTYTPLRLVASSTTNGNESTITTTFDAYETLPAGSVSMPNLAELYPNAKVVSSILNDASSTR